MAKSVTGDYDGCLGYEQLRLYTKWSQFSLFYQAIRNKVLYKSSGYSRVTSELKLYDGYWLVCFTAAQKAHSIDECTVPQLPDVHNPAETCTTVEQSGRISCTRFNIFLHCVTFNVKLIRQGWSMLSFSCSGWWMKEIPLSLFTSNNIQGFPSISIQYNSDQLFIFIDIVWPDIP